MDELHNKGEYFNSSFLIMKVDFSITLKGYLKKKNNNWELSNYYCFIQCMCVSVVVCEFYGYFVFAEEFFDDFKDYF